MARVHDRPRAADAAGRLVAQQVTVDVCCALIRALYEHASRPRTAQLPPPRRAGDDAPVTSASLVTLALLGVRDRALTLDQVARLAEPLLDHLDQRGVLGSLEELRHPAGVRSGLDRLVQAGAATVFDGGIEPVWAIAPGGHQVAAFHRNGALRHFVTRAIVEVALPRAAQARAGDPLDAVLREALALRALLKFEFSFADRDRFRDELIAELSLLDPAWRRHMRSPIDALALLADSGALVADRCLQSFIEAQFVVAQRLAARDPRARIARDEFLTECDGVGRQLVYQGRLHHAESIARELFVTALDLAANRDLLTPGRDAQSAARHAWLAEVDDVLARVRLIEDLNATVFEEVLDGVAA